MGPNNTKNSSLKCNFLIINHESYCQNLVLIVKKHKNFIKKTVSLLCVKTKSGVHKQLTFYFQMRKYFCRHLHSCPISMVSTDLKTSQLHRGVQYPTGQSLKVIQAEFSTIRQTVLLRSKISAWHACSHLQSCKRSPGFVLLIKVWAPRHSA